MRGTTENMKHPAALDPFYSSSTSSSGSVVSGGIAINLLHYGGQMKHGAFAIRHPLVPEILSGGRAISFASPQWTGGGGLCLPFWRIN